jgi:EpsI family protein
MIRFWATLALLSVSLAAYAFTYRRNPDRLAESLETVSSSIDGWTRTSTASLSPHVLDRLAPTSYLSRTYSRGGAELDLFVAYYAQQRAGETMHSPKHCLPGGGWEIWRYDSAMIPAGNMPAKINLVSIQNSGRRKLALYWYQSRDRIISDEYMGKLLLIRDSVFAGHTSGSIVRILVDDTPGTRELALRFATNLVPEVQRCLGR